MSKSPRELFFDPVGAIADAKQKQFGKRRVHDWVGAASAAATARTRSATNRTPLKENCACSCEITVRHRRTIARSRSTQVAKRLSQTRPCASSPRHCARKLLHFCDRASLGRRARAARTPLECRANAHGPRPCLGLRSERTSSRRHHLPWRRFAGRNITVASAWDHPTNAQEAEAKAETSRQPPGDPKSGRSRRYERTPGQKKLWLPRCLSRHRGTKPTFVRSQTSPAPGKSALCKPGSLQCGDTGARARRRRNPERQMNRSIASSISRGIQPTIGIDCKLLASPVERLWRRSWFWRCRKRGRSQSP